MFTDVDIPDSVDGMASAEQVHGKWPHILLLISSGCARPHPDQISDHGHFVPEPYRAATVVRHICEMMRTREDRRLALQASREFSPDERRGDEEDQTDGAHMRRST